MIVDTAQEGIWVVDSDAVTTFANERLADILGRSAIELTGMPFMAFLNDEGQARASESFAILREGWPSTTNLTFERPDGTAVWTLVSSAPILRDGCYAGALTMLTDITQSHQTETDLQHKLEGFVEAQRLAHLGNWTLDDSSGVLTCSDELCVLLGADPKVGISSFEVFLLFVHPDDRPRSMVFLQRVRTRSGPVSEQLRIITAQGAERWVALRGVLVTDVTEQQAKLHGTLQDISEAKAAEAQLSHLALHDQLTGLPNRSLFGDRLDHACSRRVGAVTVMLIDLDGFKSINDNLGHAAGDALLVTVASRLRSALRPSDTIARFGGDEFTALLEDASADVARRAAERLLHTLILPIQLEGQSVVVQASIGIAGGVVALASADELLRQADTAMYVAKSGGGSRYEVFSPQMHAAGVERRALERDLSHAELGAEMTLHYQPLADLRDGRICGFEALLRWNHPVRGPIQPDEFIPLADASGMIVPIGRWVLTEACRQVSVWQRDRPSAPPLCINVNISARQLADSNLVDDVARALDISSLVPDLLTLEVTDTVITDDEDDVCERLRDLKRLGVRISIDDVGTVYSSIGQLERIPVDELKIDRSFVASLGGDGPDAGAASSVIRLASSLCIEVVAEGIERVDQLAELRRSGCTRGQGYYLCKPLDTTSIDALLREVSHYTMPESPKLILVVDDDEAIRVSTGRVLRNVGYETVEAETGSDALRIAQETQLDAVILDVKLPDMDGLEICQQLGGISHGQLPIVHLSGTAVAVDDRIRGLESGSDVYLTKPVVPKELIAVLDALLRSRGGSLASRSN
jgi:diguanylate cyclase (GGDEF)-like protein/PAS domain S-box-containing protein